MKEDMHMRIGISCYPTLGGSGAIATELGKALAKRGHEVHFIVSGIPFRLGLFLDNIYIHEVEPMSYPVFRQNPYDMALAAKMADVVRNYQLDILHVHYAIPYAVCAFLAKEMLGEKSVKVVTTLHGTDVTVLAQDPLLRDVIRLGIEKSDAVTAVYESLLEQTNEVFQTKCPITKIYNFVDLHEFRRITKPSWKEKIAPNDEKILMHVSNFRGVKRVPDVLAVFHKVRERIPSKLLLVGEGPDLELARTITHQRGLDRDVFFLGKQDEIASLYSLADLFLLPSEKESFGLVALEAMACGVPVIGSIIGGIPEVVEHGHSGFLSPVGNVEDMAENALQLLKNQDMWQHFSKAARKRAKLFTLDEQVKKYEDVYESLQ